MSNIICIKSVAEALLSSLPEVKANLNMFKDSTGNCCQCFSGGEKNKAGRGYITSKIWFGFKNQIKIKIKATGFLLFFELFFFFFSLEKDIFAKLECKQPGN